MVGAAGEKGEKLGRGWHTKRVRGFPWMFVKVLIFSVFHIEIVTYNQITVLYCTMLLIFVSGLRNTLLGYHLFYIVSFAPQFRERILYENTNETSKNNFVKEYSLKTPTKTQERHKSLRENSPTFLFLVLT